MAHGHGMASSVLHILLASPHRQQRDALVLARDGLVAGRTKGFVAVVLGL
jgi:hypothetical protein